jgi:hypothetical protein
MYALSDFLDMFMIFFLCNKLGSIKLPYLREWIHSTHLLLLLSYIILDMVVVR